MRVFILWALAIFACHEAAERLRTGTRSSPLAIVEADTDFGSVPVTTESTPHTFVVRPAPPDDSLQFDRMESVESTCPEFKIGATPNVPGAIVRRFCKEFGGGGYGGGGDVQCITFDEETYSFDVTFAPTVELPSSDQCRIIVRFDGGLSQSIKVTGTGIAPPLKALFSTRAPIDFFTINQGQTSAASSITVTNDGSQALTVSATSVDTDGVFVITGNQNQHAIAPGATTTYTVACEPTVGDPDNTAYAGSLTIQTNDPDPDDASVTFPLACVGVDHPLLPTPDFGISTLVGRPISVTVGLENQTGATVTVNSITLKQPALSGLEITNAPTSIGPNGNATVQLTWTPDAPIAAMLGAIVVGIAGETDRDIAITGDVAKALLADVKTNVPANETVTFGRLCIGESRPRSIKMQPGDGDEELLAGYSVTGASADGPFTAAVVAPTAVTVNPPSEVTVDITALEMFTDGTLDGTLTVTTDSPTEPTTTVPLTVEILQAGATVSPPLLDFSRVVITGVSSTKTATFTNCTAGTIEVTGVTLDGASAADFDIIQIMPNGVQQLPPFTLPRNGEILIAVQMLPQSSGAKSAEVSIDFQEPNKPDTSVETIALTGEGFVKAPDRDSYYRCSTGSPIQALPLAFVGLFLVLRRRRR